MAKGPTARVCVLLFWACAFLPNGSLEAAQLKQQKTIAEIAAGSGPAVVFLETRDSSGQAIGRASGFIVDPAGVIVTNYHVIRGCHAVEVKLASGEVFDSLGVVDYDARRDLAIIKIKAARLPALQLGDSDRVQEGDRVVAIGNPLGLERTVSDGLASALRVIEGTRFIQISVPISPGSSGGPLFDLGGNVVGVTSAGISAPGAQNLNLAVPINYVVPLLGQEVRFGFAQLIAGAPQSAPSTAPAGVSREFSVIHDHGDEFRQTCLGTLIITDTRISFRGRDSSHAFSVSPADVDEAAVNVAYGAKSGAFHIRLKNWDNYNFFAVREDGTPVPPQTIVFLIQQMRGKARP